MKNTRKSKKGFTLIELIVVIAILAILAVIALPRLSGLQENANKKALVANLKTLDNAVSVYAADANVLASSVTVGVNGGAPLDKLVPTWPKGPKGTTYEVEAGVAKAKVTAAVPGLTEGASYTLAQALALS